jgi:hypothetical protein
VIKELIKERIVIVNKDTKEMTDVMNIETKEEIKKEIITKKIKKEKINHTINHLKTKDDKTNTIQMIIINPSLLKIYLITKNILVMTNKYLIKHHHYNTIFQHLLF